MIGFGIIGCGRISDKHIASLAQCEEAELRAVCDIHKTRMHEAEQSYRTQLRHNEGRTKDGKANRSTIDTLDRAANGTADRNAKDTADRAVDVTEDYSANDSSDHTWDLQISHYTDASDLLKDERVQAVIVSTHSALHAQFATAVLEAGKHLVLEKPMALSLSEVEKIIRLAEAKGLHVQVCHQLRYRPLMQRIKHCIERGSLGRLVMGVASIRLQRSEAYYQEAKWRGTWDQDGGMLLNQGVHLVDLLQWFLGDAVHVYGRMAKGPLQKQTEDVAAGIVQFAGGAIGVIEANTIAQPNNFDNAITLFGDKGTISIGGIQMNELRRWYCQDGSLPPEEEELQVNEHLLMYESFIRAIQGDESMLISAAQGKKALEIIFALYDSVRSEHPVHLPLHSFATHMMKQLEGWS